MTEITEAARDAQKRPFNAFNGEMAQSTTNQPEGQKNASTGPLMGSQKKIRDAAIEYAAKGLAVLPLNPRNKQPYIEGGYKNATMDENTIFSWWNTWPDANVGIACGADRGLVVIDVDRNHGDGQTDGVDNLRDWERKNGHFQDTWTATTGRGGQHYYFTTTLDFPNITSNQPDDLKGIDLRSNGYVCAPPSVHENGKEYFWDIAPDEILIANNDILLKKLVADLRPQKTKSVETISLVIGEGERNGTLTKLAGKLRRQGLNEEEMDAALQEVNIRRCEPPLSEKEVTSIAKSVSRYEGGQIEIAATQEENPDDMMKSFLREIYSDKYKPIPTGIQKIDDIMNGGLIPQTLILLSAEPGCGKTALASMIFESMAKSGHHGIFFNLEMSRNQMIARSLARMIYIKNPKYKLSAVNILQGYGQTETTRKLVEQVAAEYRREIADNLQYNPNVGAGLTDILEYINREGMKAKQEGRPAPNICIDYLHLLRGDDREDAGEMLKRAVEGLKKYAVEYNAIVLAIAAQSRMVNNRGVATMSAARDTSAVEYSSDLQLQLIRDQEEYSKVKLYVTKSRFSEADTEHGTTFTFHGGQSYLEYDGGDRITSDNWMRTRRKKTGDQQARNSDPEFD